MKQTAIFGKTETLKAHFENVNGLQEGIMSVFLELMWAMLKDRNHQRYIINVEMNIDKSAMNSSKNAV